MAKYLILEVGNSGGGSSGGGDGGAALILLIAIIGPLIYLNQGAWGSVFVTFLCGGAGLFLIDRLEHKIPMELRRKVPFTFLTIVSFAMVIILMTNNPPSGENISAFISPIILIFAWFNMVFRSYNKKFVDNFNDKMFTTIKYIFWFCVVGGILGLFAG